MDRSPYGDEKICIPVVHEGVWLTLVLYVDKGDIAFQFDVADTLRAKLEQLVVDGTIRMVPSTE